MRGRGRRWWSVYLADGTRLDDVQATAASIRATLPGAIVDGQTGRVTICALPISPAGNQGAKVSPEVDTD